MYNSSDYYGGSAASRRVLYVTYCWAIRTGCRLGGDGCTLPIVWMRGCGWEISPWLRPAAGAASSMGSRERDADVVE